MIIGGHGNRCALVSVIRNILKSRKLYCIVYYVNYFDLLICLICCYWQSA
ncbi:hypothetical protein GCWU000321_01167 [Dialister invisus DSM 15470]|uniref:Uncharacterized protein n=1 Tax=Dialister invisus DSM 15470 TaxID=592028 RepID=C9LNP4_9FIRM|nr:hypothetical protein GCWU000321_01167 [Dialister invisus DSM 15470]